MVVQYGESKVNVVEPGAICSSNESVLHGDAGGGGSVGGGGGDIGGVGGVGGVGGGVGGGGDRGGGMSQWLSRRGVPNPLSSDDRARPGGEDCSGEMSTMAKSTGSHWVGKAPLRAKKRDSEVGRPKACELSTSTFIPCTMVALARGWPWIS